MKNIKKLLKNKKIIFGISIVGIVLLFVIILLIAKGCNNKTGDRCGDRDSYKLSRTTINKAKKTIESIGNVTDIDIHTKLCTIKIIVTIKDDVELDKVKDMSNKLLNNFSKKEKKYYDISLYIISENEDSKVYPINAYKHSSRDAFSW